MKRKSASFLAGVLVASMVATPLSYTNVYAQEQDVVEADAAQTESESDVVSDNTDNVSENVSEKENTEKSESAIPAQQENKNAESVDKSNVENEPVQTEQKNESVTQEAAPQDSIVPMQPTEAISGVKVLKNDGNEYGMFPIVVEKMEVKDNQVTIDFIDETHTIVFGIQNIGQRINTVRQFVEVFLMRHNVIQPLGNIDNAKC